MARAIKSKKLDSRTARRAIPQGKTTHYVAISRGRALGYRRGRRGGTWVARFDAENLRREGKIGEADDILDADGVQILDYAQALEKANKFFLSTLRHATGENPAARGGYTVADAVRDYLKHLERRGSPDHSHATYDLNAYLVPKLGGLQVAKLSLARLDQWRSEIANNPRRSQKKVAADEKPEEPKPLTEEELRRRRSTTNRVMRRVKAALNLAANTGRVNANPMNWRIQPFENVDSARAEFLTDDQQRDFVGACAQEPDFQNLVLAALQTGCRLSELARLRVRDFIPSQQTIYVEKSKSGKPRHVFLAEEAGQFFKRLTINRAPDATLLVRSDGTGWSKDAVKKPMRRSCKRAGIRRLGFHQLRHSFATRLLVAGVSMKIVAQLLGHSSVRMLEKHYGHLQDEHLQRVVAAVPAVGLNRAAAAKPGKVVTLARKRGA
jgi:integrase